MNNGPDRHALNGDLDAFLAPLRRRQQLKSPGFTLVAGLLVVEVSLSLVLLTAAGLLSSSFARLIALRTE